MVVVAKVVLLEDNGVNLCNLVCVALVVEVASQLANNGVGHTLPVPGLAEFGCWYCWGIVLFKLYVQGH